MRTAPKSWANSMQDGTSVSLLHSKKAARYRAAAFPNREEELEFFPVLRRGIRRSRLPAAEGTGELVTERPRA